MLVNLVWALFHDKNAETLVFLSLVEQNNIWQLFLTRLYYVLCEYSKYYNKVTFVASSFLCKRPESLAL